MGIGSRLEGVRERHSYPSRVGGGASGGNKCDFGAFCTEKMPLVNRISLNVLYVVSLSYFTLKLPDKILDFHMSVVLSKILHSQKHSFLAFSLPYTTHALKI